VEKKYLFSAVTKKRGVYRSTLTIFGILQKRYTKGDEISARLFVHEHTWEVICAN